MAILNIKNLPDELYERLQDRARRERRSVTQEVIRILEEALGEAAPLSVLELQGLGKESRQGRRRGGKPGARAPLGGLSRAVGPGPVALDVDIFIYLIEGHPAYLRLVRPLFEAADHGNLEIVTSAITLLELLRAPYRAGNLPLAARYEALLTRSRGVRLIDPDRAQLRAAAQLRAVHGVSLPDALQLAAALTARCTAFVTNARRPPSIPGLRVVQLSEYV